MSLHNAWQLERLNNEGGTLHKFTRNIAMSYLSKYGVPPVGAGRKPSTSFFDGKRNYRIDQLVENVPNQKKRRCANEGCKLIIRTKARSVTLVYAYHVLLIITKTDIIEWKPEAFT